MFDTQTHHFDTKSIISTTKSIIIYYKIHRLHLLRLDSFRFRGWGHHPYAFDNILSLLAEATAINTRLSVAETAYVPRW